MPGRTPAWSLRRRTGGTRRAHLRRCSPCRPARLTRRRPARDDAPDPRRGQVMDSVGERPGHLQNLSLRAGDDLQGSCRGGGACRSRTAGRRPPGRSGSGCRRAPRTRARRRCAPASAWPSFGGPGGQQGHGLARTLPGPNRVSSAGPGCVQWRANHQDLVTTYHRTGGEAGAIAPSRRTTWHLRTIGFTGPSSPTRRPRGRIPSDLRQRRPDLPLPRHHDRRSSVSAWNISAGSAQHSPRGRRPTLRTTSPREPAHERITCLSRAPHSARP